MRQAAITSALAECWLVAAPHFASVSPRVAEQGTDGLGGTLLYLEQGAIWRLDRAVVVTAPAWTRDGAARVYTATHFGLGTTDVEEVDLASGARTVVVPGGSSPSAPSASSDG